MFAQPFILFDRAEELRRAVFDRLELTSSGPPLISYVTTADTPWDDCCQGTLYVTAAAVYPCDPFPLPVTRSTRCITQWACQLRVVHLRCLPVVSAKASLKPALPTPEQQTDAIKAMLEDAWAVAAGVTAVLEQWQAEEVDAVIGQWTPVGPEGGCHGGMVTVTVELDPVFGHLPINAVAQPQAIGVGVG